FSWGRLREMGRQVVAGGGAQVGLTVALSCVLAMALHLSWRVSLLLGFLVALSSTAIVLKGLTDKGEIDAPHGRLATGVLIFQDLCVVPMMLVLPFLAGRSGGGAGALFLALGKAVLVVISVLVLARTVVPRALAEILKTRSRELFLIAVILVGTLTALGTAAAGASLALGAFLAGLVISESDYGHQAMAELLPFRDVFISLFFVTVGMLVHVGFLRAHPVLALAGDGIVAGYGLNGRNLAAALRSIRAPYLIVELNAQTVRHARARGEPAFYGDATREEILRGLGAERARMLVVAISDPAATRRM